MTRTLITGGTGFIGSHLVRDCLRRGDEVTVLARPGSDVWRLEGVLDRVTICRLDPLDVPALRALLAERRPERVFLLAAATRFDRKDGLHDMELALRANVEPLRILLDELAVMAEPPRSVIRTGTLAEISNAGAEPGSLYGLSILMGTHLLRIWREWTGIPAVTARLGLTYGGDQSPDFFVPGAIADALRGGAVSPRHPAALRDLLHVDDAVAALQLIAGHTSMLPAVVNVSTGAPYRLGDVAALIAEITGQSLEIAVAEAGAGDIVSAPPSPELAALGWTPSVPLLDGLARVLDWESDCRLTKNKRFAQ